MGARRPRHRRTVSRRSVSFDTTVTWPGLRDKLPSVAMMPTAYATSGDQTIGDDWIPSPNLTGTGPRGRRGIEALWSRRPMVVAPQPNRTAICSTVRPSSTYSVLSTATSIPTRDRYMEMLTLEHASHTRHA